MGLLKIYKQSLNSIRCAGSWILIGVIALLLFGCSNDSGSNCSSIRVLHQQSWPGNGLRLIARVENEKGRAATELQTRDFTLTDSEGSVVNFASQATSLNKVVVAVMMDPQGNDALDRQVERSVADAIVQLPENVVVGLFRRCISLQQVVGFTSNSELLQQKVMSSLDSCGPASLVDAATALNQVAALTTAVGPSTEEALKAIVYISSFSARSVNLDDVVFPAGFVRVVPFSFGGRSDGEFSWSSGEELDSALDGLRQWMVDTATKGNYQLSTCLGEESQSRLTIEHNGKACSIVPKLSLPNEANLGCEIETIAANQYPFPATIEFNFTTEQRLIHDQFVAEKDKSDFNLSVKVGDRSPAEATAHLRGGTSLNCERKSYTVNLAGDVQQRFLSGAASDEFHLISMCKDDRYHQQYTGNQLAATLGLFPLQFGLVELLLDGQTRGVYLLLEKTKRRFYKITQECVRSCAAG